MQLRALEREAKSQRDLLWNCIWPNIAKPSARDTLGAAPPDARIISRALVSNVPAYPKKLPTVLIATLATLVLTSGLVLTREFLANPAPTPAVGRCAAGGRSRKAGPPARRRRYRADERAAVRDRPLGCAACRGVKGRRPSGVPVSALGEFAHNLHNTQGEGSQIAFFGVAPHLGTSGFAIKFARALAHEAASCWTARLRRRRDPADFRRSRRAGIAELADGEATSATSSPRTGCPASI